MSTVAPPSSGSAPRPPRPAAPAVSPSPSSGRGRRPRAALAAALFALGQLALLGCRHLDEVDLGPSVAGAPPGRTFLVADLASEGGGLPPGTVVELHGEGGDLVARHVVTDGPDALWTIPDLAPGEYEIRVDARPAGGPLLARSFEAEPDRAVAIVYDSGARARRTAAQVAEMVGLAVAVTALVAADLALAVLCCGCYEPCLYKIVLR